MTVYVFSLLVGYLPNGVDNAQAKRSQYFKKLNMPVKYVFTDMPYNRYIRRYNKLGFEIEDMMSAHLYFTDHKVMHPKADIYQKRDELIQTFHADEIRSDETSITLLKNHFRVAVMLVDKDWKYYHTIQFYNKERLIHIENYCGELLYTEDFITAHTERYAYAKKIRRTYKNLDGSNAFYVTYEGDKEKEYVFPDGRHMSKYEFLCEFFKKLNLKKDDILLIDRISKLDFVYPLLENKGEAKVVTFLHSGHEFLPGEDTSSVQINREYYSLFRNSDLIDVILVSTSYQKKELIESLEKYNCFVPRIECIPICGLDTLHYQDGKRKKKTLVSVSRIDRRKHIHWIMKAMIQAHEMDPEISLDVYGRGEKDFEDLLLDIQNQYQTQDYIHFKGQQNVREIYKQYPVFISASFWETMGLSLMEAVGSGNAIIGLNARYGNWEFIKDKENGIVVDFNRFDLLNPNIEEETVKKMAQAIVDIFKEENVLEQYKQKSYEIASHYLDDVVEKKWLDFIESLL